MSPVERRELQAWRESAVYCWWCGEAQATNVEGLCEDCADDHGEDEQQP